jgi:argininosuccinate synthase
VVLPAAPALEAFMDEASRHVTGDVRLRLHGGMAVVTGRRSPAGLYDYGLATYDTGDSFDQGLAKGFVELWGLPSKIAADRDRQAAS